MDIEPRWRTRESSPLSWRNLHFSLPHPHPPPIPPKRGSRKRDTEITRRVPRGTMDVTRESWRGRERWEGRTFVKSGGRSSHVDNNTIVLRWKHLFGVWMLEFFRSTIRNYIVFAVGKARDLLYRRVNIRIEPFDFNKNFGDKFFYYLLLSRGWLNAVRIIAIVRFNPSIKFVS